MDNNHNWSKNIILADADYIDKVAFNLIVNFERMLGRRIPQADMARWAECIALDGGLREGSHEIQVILVHDHRKSQLENFVPSVYATELNAQAFKSNLGEFVISAITTEGLSSQEQLFADTLEFIASQKEVERLMVIPNEQQLRPTLAQLRQADANKHITLFTMEPTVAPMSAGAGSLRTEMLGFSLLAALGIRSEEINPNA